MPSTAAIRTFLVGVPLAFAALLMFHPIGAGDFYGAVAADSTRWLAVHIGSALLFPLMAAAVWLQIRDASGRAAAVSRISLLVFAVFYGVWEALMGIASGIVAHEGAAMSAGAREGIAGAVNAISTHPIVGELGVFNSIGSLGWVVAIATAVVALHGVGVRQPTLILLGVGAMLVMHVPPFGPFALVCLSAAGLRIERERRPWRHTPTPIAAVAARA